VELGNVLVACGWPCIKYVPHRGTLVQVSSANVVPRYYRSRGEDVAVVNSSDEHGILIEVEALRLSISRKQLTDKNHTKSSSYLRSRVFPLTITLEQRMPEKSCVSPSEPVKTRCLK
jgi:methionyl-tRNA synthetase